MTLVKKQEGESQESLLRRFHKKVQASGIIRETKRHRYFVSKREATRIKAKKNARRRRRNAR